MQIHLIRPAYKGRERSLLPPLSLATIAAMTPEGHRVEIWDENVEDLNMKTIPHLVGLTGMTPWAQRAYQVAETFRGLGSRVVMGGPHAVAAPREVKNHVDSVILGEAQGLWPQVVEDACRGSLKPYYYHEGPVSLNDLPHPRRDLYHNGYGFFNTLMTSRGCPEGCFFCPAQSRPSFRPIPEVVEEIEEMRGGSLFFVDDNLAASPQRTQELFKALIPLNRRWMGQASPAIAQDHLLDLAVKSGCQGLFLGLHRLREEEDRKIIKKIHQYAIPVVGDFTFGFDGEMRESFQQVVDFVLEEGLTAARFSILTPFPGTPYYRKLLREGRIRVYTSSSYNGKELVFTPYSLEEEEVVEAFKEAWREVYSWPSMARRFLRGPGGISFFLSQNRDLRGGGGSS